MHRDNVDSLYLESCGADLRNAAGSVPLPRSWSHAPHQYLYIYMTSKKHAFYQAD